MYPYLRLLKISLAAQFRSRLSVGDASVLTLRVWPLDIDFFWEMNNGRHLTMMDLGRMDLAFRSGLVAALRKNRWGLVVGGASVRYRHRLRPFQVYQLRTEVLGYDQRWFYIHQQTMRGEKVHSAGLMRTGMTSRQGLVPPQDVLAAMNIVDWTPTLPLWVQSWIDADAQRPWA